MSATIYSDTADKSHINAKGAACVRFCKEELPTSEYGFELTEKKAQAVLGDVRGIPNTEDTHAAIHYAHYDDVRDYRQAIVKHLLLRGRDAKARRIACCGNRTGDGRLQCDCARLCRSCEKRRNGTLQADYQEELFDMEAPKSVLLRTSGLYQNPQEARARVREQVNKLLHRKVNGNKLKEQWHTGLWGIHVVEKTYLNHAPLYQAHAHLLVDGDRVPYEELSEKWDYEKTGEVGIQKVVPEGGGSRSLAVLKFAAYLTGATQMRLPDDEVALMSPQAQVQYALALENQPAYYQWGF